MTVDYGMKRIAVTLLEFLAIFIAFFVVLVLSAILPMPLALVSIVASLVIFVGGVAYFCFQIDWIIKGFRGIPNRSRGIR